MATKTKAPAGTYNLNRCGIARGNGYGQYSIYAELKSGKTVSYHTTDSQLFDDYGSLIAGELEVNGKLILPDSKAGRNWLRRNILNRVIRQYLNQ
jgi:hypothetical protein